MTVTSSASSTGRSFAGSIPELYERYMVPLVFEPYAIDLARRIACLQPQRVLEIAAGTGALTRQLALQVPRPVAITATDLNRPMLDQAKAANAGLAVTWLEADAMQLPFDDRAFDAVACQFGAMFFPDKRKAYAEVWRVLEPGGRFVFNVWNRIEANEFTEIVHHTVRAAFPLDPPDFLARAPHGFHDREVLRADLAAAGFGDAVVIDTVDAVSVAASPSVAAVAFCQGTPLRSEIEARDAARLDELTTRVSAAIAGRFGAGPVVGKMSAHVIAATK